MQVLVSLGVVALGFWLGLLGAAAAKWLGGLTASERDDRYWRWLGWLWWLVVVFAAFALIVHTWKLGLEPFAAIGSRLSQWLGGRGLAELLILAVTLAAYRLVPGLLRRLPIGVSAEFSRQQVRGQTLKSVLESVLRVLIVVIGVLFALSNLGLNVTALLAGAGVVGLGISLAAQNLIRDVLNGFFILLEDQYGVGDVITVGSLSGGVERFNLRITVLRDLDGKVHVIPNSEIKQVTVMSRDWARAVIDVNVAYDADVDRAIEVIRDEAERLYNDPDWHDKFTAEAFEVLGVQQLSDSAVVIRVLLSTRPKEQWALGREFRRRIKKRIDLEKDMEIPFTQIRVWLNPSDGLEHRRLETKS